MQTPPYLKPGDTIGVVAPARKITREELAPALERIQSWGLQTRCAPNLFGSCNQFSGTDAERLSDLQAMLDDPSVKAIISARGGYGTLRIADGIDFSGFLKAPKWIIGYSDITVLHSLVHAWGVETLHATMPISFGKDQDSVESLRKTLFGELPSYILPVHACNISGKVSAPLVGGNLSLIYAMSGGKADLDTRGKILFLEDLDEYLYHLDRMMMNLKRSGKLAELKGLVVGGLTEMKDNTIPFGKTAEEIIYDAVKDYDYPVCFGLDAGHTTRNMALILGRTALLSSGAAPSLSFV
ncbi:MAG TPA: LD-carboxypeptidase [Bacteroidia bacterium]|nr:LD-carboxypeptidase [Bacteroidia bacterium]